MRMYGIPSIVLGSLSLAALQVTAAPPPRVAAEDALRALDDKFVEDFNKKDENALVSYYAADAIVMDPGPELWIKGHDSIRKSLHEMLAGMDLVAFRIHDASYHVAGSVGWGTGLWNMTVRDPKTHATEELAGRFSDIFERRGGKWVCVVDHASMPTPPPPPAAAIAK